MKAAHILASMALFASLCFSATAADHRTPFTPGLQLEATLTSATGVGYGVAVEGNLIAAVDSGAPAVDLYIGSNGAWTSGTESFQLTASDGNAFSSVAISGNTIVAGAIGAGNAGATYVFVEPASGWTNMTQTAILTAKGAPDGARVGNSVAISGNTIVSGGYENDSLVTYPVGPGVAYVYEKPAGGWTNMSQTATLTASNGQNGDDFGYSVAIVGNTIAAGAPQAAVGQNSLVGAVYVFQKTGTHWTTGTETAEMSASDGGLALGSGVSMIGTTIASCSYNAVYLFIEPSTGWVSGTENVELQGNGANSSGLYSVYIAEDYIAAGLPLFTGARALLFVKPSKGWVNELPSFTIKTPIPSLNYGWSVAIGARAMIVGAPDLNAIYVYGPS